MPRFDLTTGHGQRAAERLHSEQIIWLTTVSPKGAPMPSPVWFLWQQGIILIHSKPNTPKVRAIRANPSVALNFHTSEGGDDVVIISGTATLVNEGRVTPVSDVYANKYESGIVHLGMTPESFANEYSQLIRIEPTRLRGF